MERNKGNFSKIIIITDLIPIKKKRKDIEKAIKQFISTWSSSKNVAYKVFHYSSKSDVNLQIVDYINWAIYRKWYKGDVQNYNVIKNWIISEFDIFKNGSTIYY